MTLTIKDLKKHAKKLGATVENDSSGKWNVFQICTPAGKCWDTDLHMLKAEWLKNSPPSWKEDAIQDVIDRMNEYGQPKDCDDPDCDYCVHSEGEANV